MSSTTTATPTTSQTASSTASSAAATTSGTSSNTDSSVAGYYFVFFAVIICILGFAGFMFLRRRRKMMRMLPGTRHDTWNRPGVLVTPDHRWLGRWRSAELSREEGLNEYGEAPPAYVPKSDEEAGPARQTMSTQPEVTVPLQTLSRDAAGFKPPDYSETTIQVPDATERSPPAPSSSRRSL